MGLKPPKGRFLNYFQMVIKLLLSAGRHISN
jgi:hypothetical protein